MILWDGMDHPWFWRGTTWTCPNCHEVYDRAVRGDAQPCLQGQLGGMDDERPENIRHHYANGQPLSINDQWFWAAVIEGTRAIDDEYDR